MKPMGQNQRRRVAYVSSSLSGVGTCREIAVYDCRRVFKVARKFIDSFYSSQLAQLYRAQYCYSISVRPSVTCWYWVKTTAPIIT